MSLSIEFKCKDGGSGHITVYNAYKKDCMNIIERYINDSKFDIISIHYDKD